MNIVYVLYTAVGPQKGKKATSTLWDAIINETKKAWVNFHREQRTR
jgi:hypothetical protein